MVVCGQQTFGVDPNREGGGVGGGVALDNCHKTMNCFKEPMV